MPADELRDVRSALARQDWGGARDAAATAVATSTDVEADLADMAADAAWWLGRLEDCIASRESAYRLYDELGQSRRAGQCAVWLYEHHLFRARPAAAGGWLRRARRALEGDVECVEYGALRLREAETAHGCGELDAALAGADAVIALGRRLRSPELEAEALQTKGRVLIDTGEMASGMAHLDEAMLFAVEGRLGPYSTGKIYCSLISACEELGDVDRAAEWTDATTDWSQQHPLAIFPGICRVHRAVVLKRRGSLAEAEREAARACDELAGSHLGVTAAAYTEVGDILRRLGELDRAETAFGQAQELCGQPCGGLALLRLAQGRVATAVSIATGCLRNSSGPLARASLLPIMAQVAIAADDTAAATDAVNELDEIVTAFPMPMLKAALLSARGRLELAAGDVERARDTLRSAVEAWQAIGVPYEVATAQTLLGKALRDAGEPAGAKASFETAAKLFDHIGAHLDARLLGDDTPPTPHPAGLTEREVEVLRLIASGMTNGDIAAALYLSVKTVSRHLSNIFTKIGVNSRAGATAFAFEHDLVTR